MQSAARQPQSAADADLQVVFRLKQNQYISGSSAALNQMLGWTSTDLFRRSIYDIITEQHTEQLRHVLDPRNRRERTLRNIGVLCASGDLRFCDLVVHPPHPPKRTTTEITATVAADYTGWEAQEVDPSQMDGFDGYDDFLNTAAQHLSGDQATENAMSVIAVDGGKDGFSEPGQSREFLKMVKDGAQDIGIEQTSELSPGQVGLLHKSDRPVEQLFTDIQGAAAKKGLINKPEHMLAVQVNGEDTPLNRDQMRGTLSNVASRAARGLMKGFSAMGLAQSHAEAVEDTRNQSVALMKAIRGERFQIRQRPVADITRGKVVAHQLAMWPMLKSGPVTASEVFGLLDDPQIHNDYENAAMRQALLHQETLVRLQQAHLDVVVDTQLEQFMSPAHREAISTLCRSYSARKGALIVRPNDFQRNSADGAGAGILDLAADQLWTLSLADFYAFVAGDAVLGDTAIPKNTAYIEAPISRIRELAGQNQGAHLITNLVNVWRARNIEIIATGVESHDDAELTVSLGIKLARGKLIGDWTSF